MSRSHPYFARDVEDAALLRMQTVLGSKMSMAEMLRHVRTYDRISVHVGFVRATGGVGCLKELACEIEYMPIAGTAHNSYYKSR